MQRSGESRIPSVTCCVPVRNGAPYLRQCLASLLSQDYPAFNVVVSVDPSDDETEAIVREAEAAARPSGRLMVVYNGNPGLFSNLNNCIRHASGELIQIFAQDDYCTPDYIKSQVSAYLQHPGAGMVAAEPSDRATGVFEAVSPEDTLWRIAHYGSVADNISCVMIPARLFSLAGYFDETFRYAGDVEFYYRVSRFGALVYSRSDNLTVRSHEGQASRGREASIGYSIEERRLLSTLWKSMLEPADFRKVRTFRSRVRGGTFLKTSIRRLLRGEISNAWSTFHESYKTFGVVDPVLGVIRGTRKCRPACTPADFRKYVVPSVAPSA